MVEGRSSEAAKAHEHEDATTPSRSRTCVGCGKKIDPRDPTEHTLRVVAGPVVDGARELAIDTSNGGRGAHVHLTESCVRAAGEKGLRRSFKSAVSLEGQPVTAKSLACAIVQAEERRLSGMFVAAARSKKCSYGAEAVRSALSRGDARLVVVATDARAAADLTEVRKAVADGIAVAWGTKAGLARTLLGKAETLDGIAVVAILDRDLAHAIHAAVIAADSLRALGQAGGGVSA